MSIIGLDASGAEVGRVEVFHGVYTAEPEFAVDFSAPTVDGRTLDVKVGSQAYHWETEGYSPTMSLPAVPGRYAKMGMFLEEPEVADALARNGIGFQAFVPPPPALDSSLDGETAYLPVTCSDGETQGVRTEAMNFDSGTNGTYFTSVTSVRLPNGETANTCGGTPLLAASQLGLITQSSQYVIFQRCSPNGQTRLYEKTCPAGTGTTSSCGSTSGSCVGCGYFTDYEGHTVYYYDGPDGGHKEYTSQVSIVSTSTSIEGDSRISYTCL
jgi:hypothetical protein